jgi:hypothetical protein
VGVADADAGVRLCVYECVLEAGGALEAHIAQVHAFTT